MQHIDTFDFHDNLEDCHDCIKFYKYSDNCDDADACVKGIINREIYMDPRPAPGYSGWYCDPQPPGQPDCMDDGAITSLADTLLHEAGHLLYDLEDEYERDDNRTTGCCGHSDIKNGLTTLVHVGFSEPMQMPTIKLTLSQEGTAVAPTKFESTSNAGVEATLPGVPADKPLRIRVEAQARAETGVALDGDESGKVTSSGTAFQIDLTPSTSTWEPKL